MAAKNELVTVTVGEEWVRLTDSGATVTSVTIQNRGPAPITIMGTTGSAPTSGSEDGLAIPSGFGLKNESLSDLFPGVSATQVWARARGSSDGVVFVSHGA